MGESRFHIREIVDGGPPSFAVYALTTPPHYVNILAILFFALVSSDADDEIVPLVFAAGEGIIPADEAPGELCGLYRSGIETEAQIKALVAQAQAAGQRRHHELFPPAPPAPEPPMPPTGPHRQRTRRRSRHSAETTTAAA